MWHGVDMPWVFALGLACPKQTSRSVAWPQCSHEAQVRGATGARSRGHACGSHPSKSTACRWGTGWFMQGAHSLLQKKRCSPRPAACTPVPAASSRSSRASAAEPRARAAEQKRGKGLAGAISSQGVVRYVHVLSDTKLGAAAFFGWIALG